MASRAFLWDTCVIYRWFQSATTDYVDHIQTYLEESRKGECDLFISTISLAEIRPGAMNREGLTPLQVLKQVEGSFKLISPSADIMSLAGYLRDQKYRSVDGPDDRAAERPLGMGDAIHLATAVALQEEFGVQDLTFHTFDMGKKKSTEEDKRTVPIIGFENWCRDCASDEEVQKVFEIVRKKPEHPLCPLPQKRPKPTDSKKPPAS